MRPAAVRGHVEARVSHPDPRRYALSDSENERIFRTRIVPQRLAGAIGQARPVLVIVGSQTGAGETSVTAMIKDVPATRCMRASAPPIRLTLTPACDRTVIAGGS